MLDLTVQIEGALKQLVLRYFEAESHRFHSLKQIRTYLKA